MSQSSEPPERVSVADAVAGDLVARDRRTASPALHATTRDRTYTYFDLCNTTAKAGNVLRHVGVRPEDTVAIDPRLAPETVFTVLGAALIGARVTTDLAVGERGDARALVVHADRESEVTAPPGTSLVVFGAKPDGSDATHWETEVWSENPAAPPAPTEPTDPLFVGGGSGGGDGDGGSGGGDGESRDESETVSHQTALAAADDLAEAFELDGATAVSVETEFTDFRTLVAGVLAPLAVGGQITLGSDDSATDGDGVEASDTPTADRRTVTVGDTIPLSRVELDG